MYNFYQSTIWKKLNQDIYQKPTDTVLLFGKEYQCILRQKKIWPTRLCRIQILGVNNIGLRDMATRKQQLAPLVKKHNPIYIQLGSVSVLQKATVELLHSENFIQDEVRTREENNKKILSLGFKKAIKENLPPSTYTIDLTRSQELIFADFKKRHRIIINKAIKHNIQTRTAQPTECETFYELLTNTGQEKGFSVVGKNAFKKLMDFLDQTGYGKLYIATLDDKIVAGAIYLIDKENEMGIYLYGGTDRSVHNTGASQLLHRNVFINLKEMGIKTIDLLGGGPTGYPDHPLAKVGMFKEGFGGKKTDYEGSFDLVYRPILYKIRALLRKHT